MAETSIEDLRAGLRQLLASPPANIIGNLSLNRSREFKDVCDRAQKLLKQARPVPAKLRSAINELQAFYR